MAEEKTRMEQAIEELRSLQKHDGDIEIQHSLADDILCRFLLDLGCDLLVEEWRKVPKWYA